MGVVRDGGGEDDCRLGVVGRHHQTKLVWGKNGGVEYFSFGCVGRPQTSTRVWGKWGGV